MKPKKSLGQNFLKDQNILNKIIEAAQLKADDLVLEVGPGQGALTKELYLKTKKILLIEKDNLLAEGVARNYQLPIINLQSLPRRQAGISNYQNYKFPNQRGIISDDILKVNLPEIIENNNFKNYKVIANIPYYITAPIIQLFLETKYPPKEMILMVQKEVAERIVATPGNMSILAVSVQYYAKAEKLFDVPRTAFWPVPEVDSAVVHITHNMEHGTKEDTKIFFRVVKAGFASKRKTLLNNLSSSFHLDKKETEEKIKKAGIDPGSRAQELSIENWKKLSQEFF